MSKKRKRTGKSKRKGRKRRKTRKAKLLRRGPFPTSTMRAHTYTECLTLNPGGAGTIAYYTYSVNGAWDPNVTGVGHQPMGFDQFTAIYRNYEVLESQIEATFGQVSAAGAASQFPVDVGIYIDDNSALSIVNPGHLRELGWRAKQKILAPEAGVLRKVTQKVTPSRYLQKPKGEETLKGTDAANPSKQLFYQVYAGSCHGTDTPAINVWVKITYIVKWSSLKETGQS